MILAGTTKVIEINDSFSCYEVLVKEILQELVSIF